MNVFPKEENDRKEGSIYNEIFIVVNFVVSEKNKIQLQTQLLPGDLGVVEPAPGLVPLHWGKG